MKSEPTTNADSQSSLFESLPLRRDNLRDTIADRIEGMIAADQLQPGTQLPSERELARTLGVNRATVREAIRVLEQRGLLKMRMGSGTYVVNIPSSTVSDSLQRYFAFGSRTHEDLVTLREILEPGIAALAAQRATAEEIARLHELVDRIEATFAVDSAEYASVDAEFHVTLARASHSELIVEITASLHRIVTRAILAQSTTRPIEGGALSHRPIYDAVAARDSERAAAAMRSHHAFTRETLAGGQRAFE